MNIERYAWASGEPLPDCPEKRFILGFIIQLVQDAQAYANAPIADRDKPEYLESVAIHRQCITSSQFRWWCDVMNVSPWRLAAFLNDVLTGKCRVNTRLWRVGTSWDEYAQIGFQTADKEYVREQGRAGGKARWENAKKKAAAEAKHQKRGTGTKRKNVTAVRARDGRISL